VIQIKLKMNILQKIIKKKVSSKLERKKSLQKWWKESKWPPETSFQNTVNFNL
jgi:hypothetical protein